MRAESPIRVLLADDHHLVRQGIRALLEKAGNLMTVNVIDDPNYGVAVDYGARFDGEKPRKDAGISRPLAR